MARTPTPWYRKSRNCWFVMLDGKQHNLGPDKKAAFEKFYRLMLETQQAKPAAESFASLADQFLRMGPAETSRQIPTSGIATASNVLCVSFPSFRQMPSARIK